MGGGCIFLRTCPRGSPGVIAQSPRAIHASVPPCMAGAPPPQVNDSQDRLGGDPPDAALWEPCLNAQAWRSPAAQGHLQVDSLQPLPTGTSCLLIHRCRGLSLWKGERPTPVVMVMVIGLAVGLAWQ